MRSTSFGAGSLKFRTTADVTKENLFHAQPLDLNFGDVDNFLTYKAQEYSHETSIYDSRALTMLQPQDSIDALFADFSKRRNSVDFSDEIDMT